MSNKKLSSGNCISQQGSNMDVQPARQEESSNDVEKLLEGLKLDDKWYDDLKVLKQLDQTEPATSTGLDE